LSSSRKLLAFLALTSLAGCGFSPLYGDAGTSSTVADKLAEVQVQNIPERTGQMLRESIEQQLYANGSPTTQLYVLTVSYSIGEQGVGIQQDTSVTRNRFIATANWTLAAVGTPGVPIATGLASTEDAQNIIDQQYFALTLETTTIDQQLADQIGQQISSQVAVYFKSHPKAG